MLTLNNLKIIIIKPKNKEGNEKIKSLLYRANDVIFPNARTYISTKRKNRILSEFIEIGKELSEVEVTARQKPKKEEILSILRDYCHILKEYKSDDDANQSLMVMKYTVSQYLRERDGYKTDADLITAMDRNKKVCEDYGTATESLKKAQDELIEMFASAYRIGV